MLAPVDKIINPRGNDIIQIVVTTRCDRECSNCTQLLPFRRDYAFMSLECFEKACVSVADWPGLVAMFGGNPCVHPQFPELCEIMASHIRPEHRGLWTNNLHKHAEIAKHTLGKGVGRWNPGGLNLNAHADAKAAEAMDRAFPGKVIASSWSNPSHHAAILLNYRDFGISEDDWIRRRESCDINQNWSGAIVERHGLPWGYFCEVAAALDGIRGENSGVPARPGWWRQGMDAFEGQVRNCCDRGCGVPLRHKGHLDTEEVYDVSASFAPFVSGSKTKTIPVDAVDSCAVATDYSRK
jgi:hypothetical protein